MKKQKILLRLLILISIILSVSLLAFTNDAQNIQEENSGLAAETTDDSSPGIPRNLLIELFINDGCTTCPKAAFCLEELAWSYKPGRVILVEEHIWSDGYDIPETNARYNWYVGDGRKGTPDAFFNGLSERIQGLCCSCGDIEENYAGYQQIIDKHLAETSPIEIIAEKSICNEKYIIQGNIINRSHSLIRNMILSGMLYYEGDESELFYLVRDIFDNQDICQLAPMEKRNFNFISNLDQKNLDNEESDKLLGIVFVQDRLTKEVIQSILIP